MRFVVLGLLCLGLSGCIITPAVIGGIVVSAATTYCMVTSAEAKQAVRDTVSGGTRLIDCPEGVDE